MTIDGTVTPEVALDIPEALIATGDTALPSLDPTVLQELGLLGWKRVGLMVAFVAEDQSIMMLKHNKSDKITTPVLGPLGETTQGEGPYVEQPAETLYRGITEELGIKKPAKLELLMREAGGWVINQWPSSILRPGEFSCAISFPVFIGRTAQMRLLNRQNGTEETAGIHFFQADEILAFDDSDLRPGVKNWLQQMQSAGLLDQKPGELFQPMDFSQLFSASLRDIEL